MNVVSILGVMMGITLIATVGGPTLLGQQDEGIRGAEGAVLFYYLSHYNTKQEVDAQLKEIGTANLSI